MQLYFLLVLAHSHLTVSSLHCFIPLGKHDQEARQASSWLSLVHPQSAEAEEGETGVRSVDGNLHSPEEGSR